jgi:hypothetical protein
MLEEAVRVRAEGAGRSRMKCPRLADSSLGVLMRELERWFFRVERWLVWGSVGALASCASLSMAAGSTAIVMVAGDASPDGNGFFSNGNIVTGGLNDSGQGAFTAQLTGTAQGAQDNAGVFVGDGKLMRTIARSGQVFPGATNGGAFIIFGVPVVNKDGEAAFIGLTTPDGGASSGYFRGAGTAASPLIELARPGEKAPDGNGVLGDFFTANSPTLNSRGDIAFSASVTGTAKAIQKYGVFRATDGALTQVARSGNPAVGSYLLSQLKAGPSLNDSGMVAAVVDLVDSTTFQPGLGLFVGDGTNSSLLAWTGKVTPDGKGTFSGLSMTAPFINEQGNVAFVAEANGTIGTYSALYFARGSNLTEVIRTGQVPPGLTNEPLDQFEWVSLNNSNQVAFTANTCCTAGIYRWDAAAGVTNIILKNQATPSRDGFIDLLYGSVASPVEMNDSGQIAFISFVIGGNLFNDTGIFFYDDHLGLQQVARFGDSLLGSTITRLSLSIGASRANIAGGAAGDELSPLNNRGQVLFSFGLADGRAGVAVWSPDVLRITALDLVESGVNISWRSTGGHTNLVQASATATGGYTHVSGNIVITGSGPGDDEFRRNRRAASIRSILPNSGRRDSSVISALPGRGRCSALPCRWRRRSARLPESVRKGSGSSRVSNRPGNLARP